MTRRHAFLLLTVLFTLLFIGLVTAGSYLYSVGSKQFAVAAFLFAFAAVMGQIVCYALFVREHIRNKMLRAAAAEQQKQEQAND